jgi:very-short-patch-repair endonuclease
VDRHPDAALLRFASAHHGLYRIQDARRAGLSRRQITDRIHQGRAHVVARGVYRVAGSTPTFEQRALAAAWVSGGAVSHRTAAQMHQLGSWSDGIIEVTVPHDGAHHFHEVICHRSRDLGRSRLVHIQGIPVTSPTRTLVDLGAVVDQRELEVAVHGALHRRLTHLDRLIAEYYSLSKRGRHGAGPIGRILRELDPTMGPAESDLEALLIRILRDHGVPAPVRQFPVTVGDEQFRLDLAYPDRMLFLEGDGFGVHGTRDAFEDDRRRQNLLVLAGWRPLRFTWRQLCSGPAAVARVVLHALAR